MTIQPITLEYDEALSLLKRAVEEQGEDYVYPGAAEGICTYECDGAPSCIAGHAFFYKGVSVSTLVELDNLDVGSGGTAIYDLVASGVLAVDADTELLLRRAQREQDGGATWADAVASAEMAVARQKVTAA